MADFFSKLDSAIDKQKEAENDHKEAKQQNAEFFGQISARLAPILEQYAKQLEDRGMRVTHSANERFVWLELKYRDGGHRALSLHTGLNSGRIEFEELFTNDDGKNYKSTTGASYDQSTWKDELFVSKLEKMIEDFVFYAPRHGGF